ncbi:adenosine 5'-phosphosulfate kinase [Ralstonia phage phiRSL1]|uniref:Adenosine 5'-phosphosulfate kinase n=1 Tax=Ralstonia phage phiRSL1 TaxID=1980924 RepID=B2ZYE1_9CAUD|nr:adenosine 5'-phosphosulfate kinase [Ralstonia phage phiRSL1]BAG41687.1 adenosine 5'-phosphosulfate kinase [Ralstonia phage phiRSL1]
MSKTIMIQGLPGSGKTTLALAIQKRLSAIHFNADWARANITTHLSFEEKDRVIQAKTLGRLARCVMEQGSWVIVDFVCPTRTTRGAFFTQFKEVSDVFSVWMNTIQEGRFADTNKLYQKPGVGAFQYSVDEYLQTPEDFERVAQDIVNQVTAGHQSYYIRYNTHSDGLTNMWRIIEAGTMNEVLVDHFDLRGHMTPGTTIEHNVTKFNVLVRGYSAFTTDADGRSIFTLTY